MGELAPPLRRRVRDARIAHLASVRPDGRPHVVPITFALEHDTIVTAVDHKPKSTAHLQRLRNVRAHPSVSVVVDHYDDDDWSALWWVRADGRGRVVVRGADFDAALARLVRKYPQYRERRPPGPVIVVTVERWTAWSG